MKNTIQCAIHAVTEPMLRGISVNVPDAHTCKRISKPRVRRIEESHEAGERWWGVSDAKERVLWHQSGVNKHGEPFIQLLMNDDVICQLSPEEARDHAKNILEATEASEQDAFMLDFMQKKVGLDVQRAMQVIVDFRHYRESRGKKGPPSDAREFVRTDKHEKPPEAQP